MFTHSIRSSSKRPVVSTSLPIEASTDTWMNKSLPLILQPDPAALTDGLIAVRLVKDGQD